MNLNVLFADTYALMEFIKGSEAYEDFIQYDLLLTQLNLAELYYNLLRESGKEIAEYYFELYKNLVIAIPRSVLKTAMQFKLKYRHEKLSYADCIGYALAGHLGVPFLTGDQKFQDKTNVIFVK